LFLTHQNSGERKAELEEMRKKLTDTDKEEQEVKQGEKV
jgi:hypothetical protein